MTDDRKSEHLDSELFIVELDERLEFGVAVVDSDLDADENSGCRNISACSGNNTECNNTTGCT
jgi:hypothetical protein